MRSIDHWFLKSQIVPKVWALEDHRKKIKNILKKLVRIESNSIHQKPSTDGQFKLWTSFKGHSSKIKVIGKFYAGYPKAKRSYKKQEIIVIPLWGL